MQHLDRNLRWYVLAISTIMVLAALLRVYGITWGFPELLHGDEPFEMNRALRLGTGAYDWDRVNKGGFYLLLFFEIAVTYVALLISGVVDGSQQFARFFVEHEANFYLAGRLTSAFLGVVTVYLLFSATKKHHGILAALLAALLLAVSSLHTINSHYSTLDVLLTLLVLCTCRLAFDIAENGGRAKFVGCGFFAGLAVATKLPAVLLVIPIAVSAIIPVWEGSKRFRPQLINLMLAYLIFGLTTIVVSPGYAVAYLDPAGLQNAFGRIFGVSGGDHQAPVELTAAAAVNLWAFYSAHLLENFGLLGLVLCVFATVYGIVMKRKTLIICLSFVFPYFLIICLVKSNLYYSRYLLPILPLMCLVIAVGLETIYRSSLGSRLSRGASLFALVFLSLSVLLPMFLGSWSSAKRFTEPDTRILATQWVEANLPENSKILMPGNAEHRAAYLIPLVNNDIQMNAIIHELKKRGEIGKAGYLQNVHEHLDRSGRSKYELTMIQHHDRWLSFAEFAASEFDHVILLSEKFVGEEHASQADHRKDRIRFYKALNADARFKRVAHFPKSLERMGQGIEIFSRLK